MMMQVGLFEVTIPLEGLFALVFITVTYLYIIFHFEKKLDEQRGQDNGKKIVISLCKSMLIRCVVIGGLFWVIANLFDKLNLMQGTVEGRAMLDTMMLLIGVSAASLHFRALDAVFARDISVN